MRSSPTALLTEGVAQEIAEMHVFSELLKRGVAVYRPVGNIGPYYLPKVSGGHIVELTVLPSSDAKRVFSIPDFATDESRGNCVVLARTAPYELPRPSLAWLMTLILPVL